MQLAIPNSPKLEDVTVNTQTWWVNLSTITPIKTSNAVELVLGA